MSKYFNTDVSYGKCQSWLDLINTAKTPKGAEAAGELMDEIRVQIGQEVLSNFAAVHAPVEPELEIVQ